MRPAFNKDVAWLEPFYDAAKDLLPSRKAILRVRGYRVALGKDELTMASCITKDAKTYVINVCTHIQMHRRVKGGLKLAHKHKPRLVCDILVDFAHELSHVSKWDHTPSQWALEHRIASRFTRVLKELGYKDTAIRKPILR